MIFVGPGVKNQFILAKTIDFSLLVQQKSSVESSIIDEKTTKWRKIRLQYIYTTFCSQEYVQWALGKYDMRCNYDVDARFLLWSTIFVISSGEKQMKVA